MHGAHIGIQLELADERQQRILAILHFLFGQEDVATGIGHPDLGLKHVEIGGDARVTARFRLVEQAVGESERKVADIQLLAGTGKNVVGVFGGLDDIERGGPEIEVGALKADFRPIDGSFVDRRAEAAEQ